MSTIRSQTPIFNDSGCFGNSYPHMGQVSALFSTCMAHEGHSFSLFIANLFSL